MGQVDTRPHSIYSLLSQSILKSLLREVFDVLFSTQIKWDLPFTIVNELLVRYLMSIGQLISHFPVLLIRPAIFCFFFAFFLLSWQHPLCQERTSKNERKISGCTLHYTKLCTPFGKLFAVFDSPLFLLETNFKVLLLRGILHCFRAMMSCLLQSDQSSLVSVDVRVARSEDSVF